MDPREWNRRRVTSLRTGPSAPEVSEALRHLRATPQHLKRTARGLRDEQLHRPPRPKGWSLNDLVAHLRGCADVQGGWIEAMLADEEPTLRYASPRTGMRKGNYAAQEFQANLRGFAQQRAALVKRLSPLALADWSRRATFTGTTPGWTQTVFAVTCGLVAHELSHNEQIETTARNV